MSRCYPGRFIAVWLALVLIAPAHADQPEKNAPARTDRYGDPLPEGVRMRFGTVRWQGRGVQLSFSPDGQTILLCDWSEVCTIDARTGRQLARTRLQRPDEASGHISVAFSEDCKTIATFDSGPRKVRFWEVASGKLLREFPASAEAAISFAWSPKGSLIAVADYKHGFYLWDAATGASQKLSNVDLGQGDHSVWIDFSPDSRLLATAVADRFIRVWDVSKAQMVREFKVRPGAMGFTSNGKQITCLLANSHEIKFWNTETGKEEASIKVAAQEPVHDFAISADGKLLAVRGDSRMFLWSVPEKLSRTIPAPASEWFGFSPDSKELACFNGRALSVWDVATGNELNPRPGHAAPVEHVVFSPSGRILASTDRSENALILWDAATGNQLQSIKVAHLKGAPSFSANDKLLVTGDPQRGIRIWDVASGKEGRLLTDRNWEEVGFHDSMQYRISPDRKRLGALTQSHGDKGSRLWLWQPTTGSLVARRPLADCYHGCLSADCQLVALAVLATRGKDDGYGSRLHVQDVMTGRDQFVLPTRFIFDLAFSPDGKTLAGIRHQRVAPAKAPGDEAVSESPDKPEICIWEVATGKERLRFPTKGHSIFARSANARLIATLDFQDTYIWDGSTGKEISRIHLPEQCIWSSCLALSPDARTLALGRDDTTILSWDVSRQLEPKELERVWADRTLAKRNRPSGRWWQRPARRFVF
jgi:WD40 repeat protein